MEMNINIFFLVRLSLIMISCIRLLIMEIPIQSNTIPGLEAMGTYFCSLLKEPK
jgi:hypothetical protein